MSVGITEKLIKIVTIIGARPQFIKAAPVCRAIQKHNNTDGEGLKINEVLVHTGQHYDYMMSKVFFDELCIPEPAYNLEVGSGSHGKQTGLILQKVEEVLLKEQPHYIIVYGDTNSTIAGALAAAKLHIPIIHVEAGLRSYNRLMPEEINRVMTDHLSTILFCPTVTAASNLVKEGFNHSLDKPPLVFNVGDVMYDSLIYNLQVAESRSSILDRLILRIKGYYLVTVHRAENTDNIENLREILEAMKSLHMPVVLPIHPRTLRIIKERLSDVDLSMIKIVEPLSYIDMIMLEKNAYTILTDSGGVQKEAFLLKIPCITLRKETEWVETVEAGWNITVGADRDMILHACYNMVDGKHLKKANNLYGDGRAAEKIVERMMEHAKTF